MSLIRIEDPSDPRIADFRDVRERDLVGRRGLFVAEGEVVLRALLAPTSRCAPRQVLIAESRLAKLEDALTPWLGRVPVMLAPQDVLDRVAGFPLHRGILGLGEVPPAAGPEILDGAAPSLVLMVSGVGNHDNMGGLMRNAAAFGAAAVILDERCCDPFYRKALRVSVGAALRLPIIRVGAVDAGMAALIARGFDVLALTPGGDIDVLEATVGPRRAVVVGSEGPGLPPEALSIARTARIRMAADFDSLNVATAAAIAMHHLGRPSLTEP